MGKIVLVTFITLLLLFSNAQVTQVNGEEESGFIFDLNILLRESDVTAVDSVNDIDPRIQYVDMIIDELAKIKINASKILLSQEELLDRLLYSPVLTSVNGGTQEIQTYDNGGFDMSLMDFPSVSKDFNFWEQGLSSDVFSPCSNNFPTSQCNFNWYSNDSVDIIYNEASILRNDLSASLSLIQRLQNVIHDDLPSIVILETLSPIYSHVNFGLTESEAIRIGYNLLQHDWGSIGQGLSDTIRIGTSTGLDRVLLSPLARDFEGLNEDFTNSMVWQGLYDRDDDLRISPLIAAGFPIWNSNYTIAEINLRNNVAFKDGHLLDAEDVVTTYEFLLNDTANPTTYATFLSGEFGERFGENYSISEVNSSTVRFEFPDPMENGREFDFFSFGIVPSHEYGNVTHPTVENLEYGLAMIDNPERWGFGTGPYYYSEFGGNLGIDIMKRNDNYWNGNVRAGRIEINRNILYLEQISFLREQKIDLLLESSPLSPFDIDSFADGNISLHLVPGITDRGFSVTKQRAAIHELGINHRHPIIGTGKGTPLGLENVASASGAARNVRKAINHAIPRQQIIDSVYRGLAIPGITRVSPRNFGFDPSLEAAEYNLTKSIILLREVGYDVPLPTTDSSETNENIILDQAPLIGTVILLIFVILVSGRIIMKSRKRLKRFEKPLEYSKDYIDRARKMAEDEDFE